MMEQTKQPENPLQASLAKPSPQEIKPLPSAQEIRRQLGWDLLVQDQKSGGSPTGH
jgi:hypothetical protein